MNSEAQMKLFYEIFGAGLPRLAPGDDRSTTRALETIRADRILRSCGTPSEELRVLDIGCGNGAQTIRLAKEIRGTITAVDNHQPYLDELTRRAGAAEAGASIRPHLSDMGDLGAGIGLFDLIWAEGSAYILGIAKAMAAWRSLLVPGGHVAITELTWLKAEIPDECRKFFEAVYPAMTDIATNVAVIEACGYKVLDHFTLPESSWWDAFYAPLEKRLDSFRERAAAEPELLPLLEMVEREIETYRRFSSSYGYVFYMMRKVDAESLGFDPFFAERFDRLERPDLVPARVVAGGRGHYRLRGGRAARGELTGKLFHDLLPHERPVVGDWVAVAEVDDHATIHAVLERRSVLVRRAAGSSSDIQTIAANVDLFFIVTAADGDFNLRRLERYLAAVWDSGARPIVVLNKIDIGEANEEMSTQIAAIAPGVPVLCVSAATGEGMERLLGHIGGGKTVGLVGSSGVGKSSIVNFLQGQTTQATRAVRGDGKGRHTTTHRELVELPGGALLIDTPGMREFGMADDEGGVEATFADIVALAERCHFRDCDHQGEPECAVEAAVESGELDRSRLDSYRRLQREVAAVKRRQDPLHAGRPKRRWKTVSKKIRDMKKSGSDRGR